MDEFLAMKGAGECGVAYLSAHLQLHVAAAWRGFEGPAGTVEARRRANHHECLHAGGQRTETRGPFQCCENGPGVERNEQR